MQFVTMAKFALPFVASILASIGTANAQQDLRVGLMDAEPGVIRNNSQLSGRDIDIWNAIGQDSGLSITYVFVSSPSALLAALDDGKVDVAGWAVSRTPATEAKYLLTDTILPSAEAILVPSADTRIYRGLEDIRGLTFATLKGTEYANYLKKTGVAVKEFDTLADVLKATTSGEANAAMFSGIIARYMLKEGKLPNLQVVSSYQPALSRPIMAAFPKTASANYDRANESLKKLKADGTIARIKDKYGL